MENTRTKEEYRIEALKQRMGGMVADYEDKIAELRADYTILANAYEETRNQLLELQEHETETQEAETS